MLLLRRVDRRFHGEPGLGRMKERMDECYTPIPQLQWRWFVVFLLVGNIYKRQMANGKWQMANGK
jgi:hypothetical protein